MLLQRYQILLSRATSVIFDYDSTIARVPVNWSQARQNYRVYLAAHFPGLIVPESARVDEMEKLALQYAPARKDCVFQYRLELESALDGVHEALPETCALIRKLRMENTHRLFIISNNLHRTVEAGLAQLKLAGAFEAILGVDHVGVPKPDPGAFGLLSKSHGLIPEGCIFIGDNDRTDGGFCRALGIPFINITDNNS